MPDLVHRLKYGDRLRLATSMGQWMARAGQELLIDADALPAVPLPGGPAALAAAVGGGSIRLQHSPGWWHQTAESGLRRGPPARARHIAAGWSVAQCAGHERTRRIRGDPGRQGCHPGKLVHDVLTSGATVDACARAPPRAGARNVDVRVFARVVAAAQVPI